MTPSNGVKPQKSHTFEPEPNTLILEDQSLSLGFVQLPKKILWASNLSRDAKILYAVLLGYAWQEDRCFPGYRRLCQDVGATEKMVRKYMRELDTVGLVSQRRRGQGKTNLYTLHDLRTVKIPVQEHPNSTVQEPVQTPVPEREKLPRNNKQSNNKQNTNNVVVDTLTKFGVSKRVAQKLVEAHPEDYILQKLDLVQWMVATGSSLVGKNPAGYLRRAIEDDYLPPPKYQTPAQRQKDEKTLQAAQQRRQEAEEEYRRTKERLQQRSREEHPPQPVGKDGLNTESAWSLTLEQLKEQTPRPTFETWLRDTMLLEVEGNTAHVMVPSQFALDWLEKRMYQSIARTLGGVLQQDVEVEFIAQAPE